LILRTSAAVGTTSLLPATFTSVVSSGRPAHQLAHPGLDPAKLAEDDLSGLGFGERPVRERLEVLQDHLEALIQVGEHVIVVERLAMMGMERSRGSTHQYGTGDDLLQLRGLLQYSLQRWACHVGDVIRSENKIPEDCPSTDAFRGTVSR